MPYNDIFVDNDTAKHLSNPMDGVYKEFLEWLFKEGSLVISPKIMVEYCGGCGSQLTSNILTVIDAQTKAGRINRKTNADLKSFIIPKHIEKRLQANRKDWNHIKLVLLSDRHYAVSQDNNLISDLSAYPGVRAIAVKSPANIRYR